MRHSAVEFLNVAIESPNRDSVRARSAVTVRVAFRISGGVRLRSELHHKARNGTELDSEHGFETAQRDHFVKSLVILTPMTPVLC